MCDQVPGSILIGIIAITAIVWGLEGSGPTTIVQVGYTDGASIDGHATTTQVRSIAPRARIHTTLQTHTQVPKFDLSIAEGLDFSTTFSVEMTSAVLAFIFVGP